MSADQPRTRPTDASVAAFVEAVASPSRRRDARTLLDLMSRATGEAPRMWGPTIVGFGTYHYRYPSGREGDMAATGFSPRTAAMTVYFADGFDGYAEDLAALGPHSLGKGCLYLKDLTRIDLAILDRMIRASYARVTAGDFGTRRSGRGATPGTT